LPVGVDLNNIRTKSVSPILFAMKRAADEGTEDDNVKRTNFEENGEEPRVEEAAKTEDGGGEGSKDESKPASGGGGGHKGVDQRFKIFVGGIDVRVTTEELQTHFETFGKVVDCVVMQDRATGRSRGFGFATMETQEMFDAALDNKSHELYGKVIVDDIDLQPWQHHNSTKLKPHQTNYANDEHPLSLDSLSLFFKSHFFFSIFASQWMELKRAEPQGPGRPSPGFGGGGGGGGFGGPPPGQQFQQHHQQQHQMMPQQPTSPTTNLLMSGQWAGMSAAFLENHINDSDGRQWEYVGTDGQVKKRKRRRGITKRTPPLPPFPLPLTQGAPHVAGPTHLRIFITPHFPFLRCMGRSDPRR
jgi:RNA recognition motif-containing protein